MPKTDVVRAKSRKGAKERAAAALADMGLPISDAIRLLRVGAGDYSLPFAASAPNKITSRAAAELEGRRATAFAKIADFMADLSNDGD
jgi:DNA-damage-inducible protein J